MIISDVKMQFYQFQAALCGNKNTRQYLARLYSTNAALFFYLLAPLFSACHFPRAVSESILVLLAGRPVCLRAPFVDRLFPFHAGEWCALVMLLADSASRSCPACKTLCHTRFLVRFYRWVWWDKLYLDLPLCACRTLITVWMDEAQRGAPRLLEVHHPVLARLLLLARSPFYWMEVRKEVNRIIIWFNYRYCSFSWKVKRLRRRRERSGSVHDYETDENTCDKEHW